MVGTVDMDGPELDPALLQGTECALDSGQGFVGGDGFVGEAGADELDAVEPSLGGDAGFVPRDSWS